MRPADGRGRPIRPEHRGLSGDAEYCSQRPRLRRNPCSKHVEDAGERIDARVAVRSNTEDEIAAVEEGAYRRGTHGSLQTGLPGDPLGDTTTFLLTGQGAKYDMPSLPNPGQGVRND